MVGAMLKSMKLGVIIEVDGSFSQVGMYNVSNDSQILWDGEILSGPKLGALLTIYQNNIKIIAKVSKETIIDHQNTISSKEFDNRYSANSISRLIELKTQGVIINGIFQVSSEYVPMIGNEVSLTTKEDLDCIFGIHRSEKTITIGKSILEKQPIDLSINKFFASHIGIFGNTGSGKSNTLHKLFLQLFRTAKKENFYDKLIQKAKFFVIDFNGEYTSENQFGIDFKDKKVFELNTRDSRNKIPIDKSYLYDADILSILFDARPATQIPFLRQAMSVYNKNKYDENSFAHLEINLLKKLIKDGKTTDASSIDNWIQAAENFGVKKEEISWVIEIARNHHYGNLDYLYDQEYIFKDGAFTEFGSMMISKLEDKLDQCYKKEKSAIKKLKCFLEFQKVYKSAWGTTKLEYINPLFARIDTAFDSLEKVVDLKKNIEENYKCVNIISLVHVNQEIKRLIPMLLSKMIYDNQKRNVAKEQQVYSTCHLIIDEAHNILSSVSRNDGDSWQDYRLSVFEEIIKEGRKFGFYLTLASQRPADISPTIMSQLHNYFIHRIVNEHDLQMLATTMPTLDKFSYNAIPLLGQGEAIITGTAMKIPVMAKIDWEESVRPKSDDVLVTKIWADEN